MTSALSTDRASAPASKFNHRESVLSLVMHRIPARVCWSLAAKSTGQSPPGGKSRFETHGSISGDRQRSHALSACAINPLLYPAQPMKTLRDFSADAVITG